MSKVQITIEDVDLITDEVTFKVEFDPPLKDNDNLTAAQSEAAFMIEVMQRRAQGENLAQMAEEMDEDQYGAIDPDSLTYEEKPKESKPN